jgi:formiminotetrahydrofolate cyclodeaminase
VPLRSRPIETYLADLSSASPAPGGGSAAALSGAVAAGLGLMVSSIAAKKGDTPELVRLRGRILPVRERFLSLADEDEQAFSEVISAFRLKKDDPARTQRIQHALHQAAKVPLETAELARDFLALLAELAPLGTKSSTSDAGVAALLSRAALEAALLNVDINLVSITDEKTKSGLAARRDALLAEGRPLAEEVLALVRAHL